MCGAMACSDPTSVSDGDVSVTSRDGEFVIRNRSSRLSLTHTFVDGDSAPLILLAPCDTWTDIVPPGSSERVPYEEVIGFTPESRIAQVYWCLLHEGEVRLEGSVRVPYR